MLRAVVISLILATALAYNNGLGQLPVMGWNTWCTDGQCMRDVCSEAEIKEIADAMEESGMLAAGYNYIGLDDCWAATYRDSQGRMVADPKSFPNGLKPVADYLHSKGFKFGLYTDTGLHTCKGGRPGSYGHYEIDAQTYADWHMDLVKMDFCDTVVNGTQLDPRVQYPIMSKAMNKTGRPMIFSMCEWGLDTPSEWGFPIAQAWRVSGDHHDNWASTMKNLETVASPAVGSKSVLWGHNDLDFLMTGGQECPLLHRVRCPGQSDVEYRTEYTMWTIAASQMLVATDVRNMPTTMKDILLNEEVLAVVKDYSRGGYRVGGWNCSEGEEHCQIWRRTLSNGDMVVALLNTGTINHGITVPFSMVGWTGTAKVRDLWSKTDLGTFIGTFTWTVVPHGVMFVRFTR